MYINSGRNLAGEHVSPFRKFLWLYNGLLASYYNCIFQVKAILDELLEKLPEEFNMMELHAKAEEKTPYILVALQECERMNSLIGEIRRSLKELDLGLKVREERHVSEFSEAVAIREAAWSL